MQEDRSYVADTRSLEEMTRLQEQGILMSLILGNPMSGIPSPETIHDGIDLACGPGEWLRRIAQTYPHMRCIGMDKSGPMIQYASAQAQAEGLSNATYYVGDATVLPINDARGHPIPEASFDLVNGRLIFGFMTRSLWPDLIREAYRLLRPGGYLRIINNDFDDTSNSTVITTLYAAGRRAMLAAGKSWDDEPGATGINRRLPGWFQAAGLQEVKVINTRSDHSAGQATHEMVVSDYLQALQVGVPFLTKYGGITASQMEQMREQLIEETESGEVMLPDGEREPLRIEWHHLTIVGQKPLTH